MRMRIRPYMAIVTVMAALLTGGCATIISGGTETVTFNSSPSGATVSLNGRQLGKTPLTVNLDRPSHGGNVLKFEKEGYETLQIPYSRDMNMWWLGNILTGGTTGSTTDYVSGAMYEYQPNFLQVTLEPKKMGLEKLKIFAARNKVRYFVLTNFSALSEDIATGKGEYLTALMAKLHLSRNDKARFVPALQRHLTSKGQAQAIADYVVNSYVN